MKKAEFLSEVKLRANNNPAVEYSNKDIKTVVEAVLDVLKDSMTTKDASLQLVGFASFGSKLMPERKRRNVRTGESVNVPAHYVPFCKISSSVKVAAAKIEIAKPKKAGRKKKQ